jgi:[ribosomal protein S5]-alanine N-acetyltransferase
VVSTPRDGHVARSVDSESRTAHLLLRRMQESDRDDLRRIHADPRVMATLGGVRSDEQTEEFLRGAIAHWEQYDFGFWTVRHAATGRFAGRGGLLHTTIVGGDDVEVAYAFLPEFWGRGLATEFARESVRTAFEVLGLDDVVCFALPTNRASRRVMEKVGFRYERDVVYHGLPHVFYRLRAGRERATPRG